MWNREELAWAAGFFDGEGSFCVLIPNRKTMRPMLHATIHQTNKITLERFQTACGGLGRITGPYTKARAWNSKPYWVWQTSKFEHAQQVVLCLWPWLSSPKRTQALAMLRKKVYFVEPI